MKPSEAAEILEGIEEFRGNLPEDGLLVEEAVSMAISALEKQEPMKPLQQEMDIDVRAITPCGFCGEELPRNILYDFCPYCGQAIDRGKE